MAYTTINKSGEHFNTKLYTGDGNQQNVTGVGFQPDWTWVKQRGAATDHSMQDAVRGVGKQLQSNDTSAETSNNNSLVGFVSDGFTVGFGTGDADAKVNASGGTYASWNWKANGAGSANTDGSISSTVSANTTSGFSIVKYTGNRSQTQTIGHGLGSIPKIIIVKNLDVTQGWTVYSSEIGANERLVLNNTNAKGTCTACFGNTRPTDTVFTVGDDADTNGTGNAMIAYCFSEKQGYSKFGSYIGNGNADGTFVYTGFSPAFVMMKNASLGGKWLMMDNKRPTSGGNPNNARLFADVDNVESTSSNMIDMLSNGFKITTSDTDHNGNGDTNIYMAFAEAPLVGTNGVTAKAR